MSARLLLLEKSAWIMIGSISASQIFKRSKYPFIVPAYLPESNEIIFCRYFEIQLDLADKYELPLFLHCRNAHDDFIKIIENNKSKIRRGGVVHTYDGSLEHAKKLISMGFHIGLNGCSLKTEANLEVVKALPNDKIMLETDSPWCEIRPTHASSKFVKTKFESVKKQNKQKWQRDVLVAGRNEPCTIIQVLEVIAGVKGEDAEKLSEIFYNNTMKVFFSD